jgi:hypothetical protein
MTLAYMLPVLAALSTSPEGFVFGEGTYPLVGLNMGLGKWIVWFMIIGGLASCLGTYNAYLNTAATALHSQVAFFLTAGPGGTDSQVVWKGSAILWDALGCARCLLCVHQHYNSPRLLTCCGNRICPLLPPRHSPLRQFSFPAQKASGASPTFLNSVRLASCYHHCPPSGWHLNFCYLYECVVHLGHCWWHCQCCLARLSLPLLVARTSPRLRHSIA